jgi:hypothetical protein
MIGFADLDEDTSASSGTFITIWIVVLLGMFACVAVYYRHQTEKKQQGDYAFKVMKKSEKEGKALVQDLNDDEEPKFGTLGGEPVYSI